MSKPAFSMGCGKPRVNLLYHHAHPSQCPACWAAYPFDEDAWYHERAEDLKNEIDRTIIAEIVDSEAIAKVRAFREGLLSDHTGAAGLGLDTRGPPA